MANKIRIMELSSELGVSNKDLLQVLRELDIPVKSHVSSITDEEAAQVREKIQSKEAAPAVVQREVQPGVILRRRKKVQEKPISADEPGPAKPRKKSAEKTPKQVDEQVKPEPVVQDAAGTVGIPLTGPDASVESLVETAADDQTPSGPEQPSEAVPLTEPAPEATDVKEQAAEAPAAEPAEQPDAEGVQTAQDTVEKPRKRRTKKKEPVIQAGPQVRIISKPEVKPDFSYQPESKPYKPTPVTLGPEAAIPKSDIPRDEKPVEGQQERKKKKKGKRTVEIAQPQMDPDLGRTDPSWKKKRGSPVQDRTGGKIRARRPRQKGRDFVQEQQPQAVTQPIKAAKRKVRMDEAIRISDMAKQMGLKAQEIIKALFSMGVMTTINQSIDVDTATLVASEFGYEVEQVGFMEQDFTQIMGEDKAEDLTPRSPVVTIMGHVDHGKTSLLDAIRETNVTKGEAGGITQHIGAYHVQTSRGTITFLDTPGHEAFTAMRARGAQVTDLVILVVAADDGVMEQTKEAVNHARAAKVPIVVAVNKIDKEDANPERVLRELSEIGLLAEAWGGDTIFANVSAKQRIGLDELLEMVLLQAEVLDLKANPNKRARGRIVEARLDKGRGPVATVLIQEGSLHESDVFVCGLYQGKVRAMFNDQGQKIKEAGPAYPIEVQGFDGLAESGDEFVVVADEKIARRIASSRQAKEREKALAQATKVTLDSFLASKAAGEAKVLNLVIKTDVQGSAEAIAESLNKLSTDEVRVQIVHAGAGAITESDVMLAAASSAIIIGFNVRPMAKVKEVAESASVEIRFYDIIYDLLNDIRDALTGMLSPIIRESYLGQAEVRQTFNVPKIGTVAGCAVMDGKLLRNAKIRLLREGVVIYTGKLSSLKRFKDDAKEVLKGFECGVGLANFNDIKVGDVIEAFEEVSEKATL
ncbi:MAG TPA: translation initiation factor IF-2 [Desulfonatronum sp.]|nr:translation initiation factor IF-2 [Desulfonatronum sp.]